ncbi:MAG: glycoside hydrolase family 78 protein, partial [Planctomycetota bacterium]
MRWIAAAALAMSSACAGPEPAGAPAQIAPVDDASTLHVHPHLSWTQVYAPRAEAMPEYEIEIARGTSFADVVDRDHVAAVITRYVPAEPLPPGRYWCRVRGRDAAGTRTPWSEAASFVVAPPQTELRIPAGADFARIQAIVMLHPHSGWPQEAPQRGAFTQGKPRWGSLSVAHIQF